MNAEFDDKDVHVSVKEMAPEEMKALLEAKGYDGIKKLKMRGPFTGWLDCPRCGWHLDFFGNIPRWRMRWHDLAGCLLGRIVPRKINMTIDWVGISLLLAMAISLIGLARRRWW